MFDYEESLYDYKVMIYKQELKKIIKILERNESARENLARIVKE